MLEIQTASELRTLAFRRLARLEGILAVLMPLILLMIPNQIETGSLSSENLVFSIIAIVVIAFTPFFIHHRTVATSVSIFVSYLFAGFALFPQLIDNPTFFLGSAILVVATIFIITDAFRAQTSGSIRPQTLPESAFWASAVLPIVLFVVMLNRSSSEIIRTAVTVFSTIIAVTTTVRGFPKVTLKHQIALFFVTVVTLTVLFYTCEFYAISVTLFALSILGLLFFTFNSRSPIQRERWYDFLLDHPARNLMGTFLFLSIIGTVLLSLPIASSKGGIALIDAAFTSVSAVCVTGLTVLDTPNDFTVIGQVFILLLIQLGGLGIMGVATVGIHAAGRRLSLKRERAMISIMNSNHSDLVQSLILILKFTFTTELVGAIALFFAFVSSGSSISSALWNGIFTSISAFCNAGFALFSDNLTSYQTNPSILIIVSFLIILGGISPAISLFIPRMIRKHKQSEMVSVVLITTAVLLIGGTIAMLIFEWNGVLSGLSTTDRVVNAWFQSVTFRTAGFNSVAIGDFANTTLIVSMVLMFIGGSPGGTAGGIKTTTVAVLILAFFRNIRGFSSVTLSHRTIPQATINRAVSILFSAGFVWAFAVFMLEMTQNLSIRDLLFEATSAIGTVGLSTGITAQLDEAGKLIIMFLMYAGRIGPITLFMIFTNDSEQSDLDKPDAQIALQ